MYIPIILVLIFKLLYIYPVPRVAPRNVTVVRINSTAISVSWNPLTLQEARGWPVYVVYLQGNSQRTACELQSVNTSDSSVVIGNLDPASYYSVVVQVRTAAGTREELKSQPGELQPMLFVILIHIMSCACTSIILFT